MARRSAWLALVAALASASALALPASASERELYRASALESSILAQMNAVRARHGLAPLRPSKPLSDAARAHSEAMVTKGFFSHNSANGANFGTRVRKWYSPKGYRSWSAGENLLWRSPDVDAAAAVQMWMQSPPHRANLLRAGWREVGLGAVHAFAAPGSYGGLEVTVVTADFGARA